MLESTAHQSRIFFGLEDGMGFTGPRKPVYDDTNIFFFFFKRYIFGSIMASKIVFVLVSGPKT